MAITRAQQVRQMLKDGKVAMQGGVKNYLGKQKTVSDVPLKWQSGSDKPATELAYITKAEKDLLLKKDIHGSLKDGPNTGPEGIMSLDSQGDKDTYGDTGQSYGDRQTSDNSPEVGDRGGGYQEKGDPGYQETINKIREAAKAEEARQQARQDAEKKRQEEESKQRAKDFKISKEKTKTDRKKRINKILTGGFKPVKIGNKFYDNPYGLSPTELADLNSLGIDPNKEGPMTARQQDIFDEMMEKNDRFSGVNLENFQNKFNLPTTGITSLDLVTGLLEGPLSKGSKINKEFFTDDVLGAGKFKYNGNVVNPEIFSMLNPTEMQEIYGDYMGKRMSGETDAYGNPTNLNTGGGGGDNNQTYVPPIIPEDDTTEEEVVPSRNLGGLAPRFAGSIFDFTGLANGGIARAGAMDGGRMMMMANEEEDDPEGGIMDLESGRQMYFLGKLVKKATKAIKKVAKSPIGKAALIGGLGYLGATKMGGMKGLTKFFGANSFNPFKTGIPGVGKVSSPFGALASKFGITDLITGNLTGLGKGALFAGVPAALSYFMTPKEKEENNDDYYKANRLNIADIRNRPFDFLSAANQGSRYNVADGGLMRTGYAEGSEEPVAKKTMPLLDMDGQEMDLREEGGFVPLGRMERADDVPARLSKNEFVFTADAVRNAGEGDIDKGAEVMYNMMKNLESGGEVSEESQGLEGAREMFKTSQRLEEVI